MRLLKILPILVMVGGGLVMSTNSKRFFSVVTDKIRVLVTGMELARIADEVRFHFLDCGEIPGLDDEEEFGDFLRGNFRPYWGSRDTALDLWDNPYRLVPGRDQHEAVIFSLGPNGEVDDDCAVINGEKLLFEQDCEDLNEEELQEYLDEMELSGIPDDLCITLEFALRDTPFRSLKGL